MIYVVNNFMRVFIKFLSNSFRCCIIVRLTKSLRKIQYERLVPSCNSSVFLIESIYMNGGVAYIMKEMSEYAKFVDVIRRNDGISKSALSELTCTSLPTTHEYIRKLVTQNILSESLQRPTVSVNSKYGYYWGVAIGGANVKVTIVDFSFTRILDNELVEQLSTVRTFVGDDETSILWTYVRESQCFCTNTPTSIVEFLVLMDKLFSYLAIANESILDRKVKGIGFAFSGAVNHATKTIVKSPNISYLEDVGINTLVSTPHLSYCAEKDIQISFENNANASVIAEKYALQKRMDIGSEVRNSKNIACLYLGTGLGLGTILNDELYRGAMHSGEIGHIPICLRPGINNGSCRESMGLEQYIRKVIWKMSDEQHMSEWTMEMMRTRLSQPIEDKVLCVELLGEAIGYAINIISLMLNVELIVLTGRLTEFLQCSELNMWSVINKKRLENPLGYVRNNCFVIESDYGLATPAIGAAIVAAFDSVEAPLSWKTDK